MKRRIEDSMWDLKLQWDRYLYEAKETSTSLSAVKNVFLHLKLIGSLFDQMAQLAGIVEMKDQALVVGRSSQGDAHKEMNSLRS